MRGWGAAGVRRRNTGEGNERKHARNREKELMGWRGGRRLMREMQCRWWGRAGRGGTQVTGPSWLIKLGTGVEGKSGHKKKRREEGTLEKMMTGPWQRGHRVSVPSCFAALNVKSTNVWWRHYQTRMTKKGGGWSESQRHWKEILCSFSGS